MVSLSNASGASGQAVASGSSGAVSCRSGSVMTPKGCMTQAAWDHLHGRVSGGSSSSSFNVGEGVGIATGAISSLSDSFLKFGQGASALGISFGGGQRSPDYMPYMQQSGGLGAYMPILLIGGLGLGALLLLRGGHRSNPPKSYLLPAAAAVGGYMLYKSGKASEVEAALRTRLNPGSTEVERYKAAAVLGY